MVNRISKLSKSNSFFLFGARGTGKSSLLKVHFKNQKVLWIDLLNEDLLDQYLLNPQSLFNEVESAALKEKIEWVVIDEVQKAPKLLNVVHQLIESKYKIKFALTGSSARKLKQKGVNLLAGRAFVEELFPLTFYELKNQFNLDQILKWGSLPKIYNLETDEEKANYLRSYSLTYIKTEIQEEQWVRKIEPFRKFLPVAAQMNGQILNYSNIARDIGVDITTVQNYFEILEETYLGFFLPAFNKSVRKQQRSASKFYFFDLGIKNSLERKINIHLTPETTDYGNSFEQFIICEIVRLNSYLKKDFELTYFRSKDGLEIDLILDRPGQKTALVEIKSKTKVDDRDTKHLERFHKDVKNTECFLLSLDKTSKVIGSVQAHHWQKGLSELGFV